MYSVMGIRVRDNVTSIVIAIYIFISGYKIAFKVRKS